MVRKADPKLKRAEKPSTFYSYTQGENGLQPAMKTSIVLYAESIQDKRS